MLWISHRGESFDAPENTMRAFRLAWERGTNGIELDVRLTADGQVVCIHDPHTGRVGDKDLVVAEEPYDALCEVDVGQGERIPLLSQVLSESPTGRRMFIELKVGAEILSPLASLLEKSPVLADNLRIIDFKNDNLKVCKTVLPNLRTYLIQELVLNDSQRLSPGTDELLALADESKTDGFDLQAHQEMTMDFFDRLRGNGADIAVWTIDDLDLANKFVSLGIDTITSNRASFLQKSILLPEK